LTHVGRAQSTHANTALRLTSRSRRISERLFKGGPIFGITAQLPTARNSAGLKRLFRLDESILGQRWLHQLPSFVTPATAMLFPPMASANDVARESQDCDLASPQEKRNRSLYVCCACYEQNRLLVRDQVFTFDVGDLIALH
jgi:hypothetical protein